MFRLIESGPCSEYIDEVWPSVAPLWPSDAKQRFAMRLFIDAAGGAGWMGPLFWPSEAFAEKLEGQIPQLKACNACLEKHAVPGGDFFLGGQFSMVEVMVGPMIMRWTVIGEARGFNGIKLAQDLGLTRLVSWMEATRRHPSVLSTSTLDVVRDKILSVYKPFNISYEIVDGNVANLKAEIA